MEAFKEIPNEQIIGYLQQRIEHAAAFFDTNLFALMRKFAPDHYDGGLWEVREYPNGAFAYVLADDTIVPRVNSLNQSSISCSIEALSVATNLFVLGYFVEAALEHDDEPMAERFCLYRDALYEAVFGHRTFIVENNVRRAPTEEELAAPHNSFPESDAISALID